jgi:hypothetical protein
MKKLFISMLAVAALASCSQEDVIVADKGDLIGFNSFVENSTRATDPSYSTSGKGVALTQFDVYGAVKAGDAYLNIFAGNTVSKGGADYGDAWSMANDAPKHYWIAGANYIFDAVVDATEVVKDNATGLPTELKYSASSQKDMLHDRVTTTGKPATNDGIVTFNFTHLLSKVNFTVTNEDKGATGYSFVVKNINFAGNVAGVYNVADAAWDDTQFTTGNTALGNERTVLVDGVSTKVKDIVVDTEDASSELGTEVLFLPGTYNISFTVDILYNNVVITSTKYPAEGTYTQELKQNNAYNFNVNVSVGDEITFTATALPNWNPNDTITLQ